MGRTFIIGFVVCLLVFLAGCSHRIGDLSILSTRSVSLNKVDLDKMPQEKNVVGKDSKIILLGIPLGFPHLENAVDDALDKGKGDVIIDPVIQVEGWSILILGENSISVKGNVVNTKGVAQ